MHSNKNQHTTKKKGKIVVVDDHKEVLDGIIKILNYGGYEAEGWTQFNDEVEKKLKSETISLIILDIMLSGKDGREIAKELKRNDNTKQIPILMISAYPDMEISVKKAGAEYFVPKPFGAHDMISKLDEIVKN